MAAARSWIVAGLALEALGLLVVLAPFLGEEPGLRWPNLLTGIPVILAGAILAARGLLRVRAEA